MSVKKFREIPDFNEPLLLLNAGDVIFFMCNTD
jgi:hypothetical protein